MKRLFLFLVLCIVQTGFSQDNPTTYFLIRHAEKVDNSKDPDLSEAGRERALAWRAIFSDIPFNAVYSSDFKRTRQTAAPTAEKNKTAIQIYDHKNVNIEKFKQETKGKTVLVVGHSNSIPNFVNLLIGEQKYTEIDETIFGNLYMVTLLNGKVTHSLLKL